MTQYNTLNVKQSNSQLNKLKSGVQDGTEVTLNISSNEIDDSNDETNFPHRLLLTVAQVSRFQKALANNSSANTTLSKTQLSKMLQLGGFLCRPLGPLPKTALPLRENVLKPSAKSVLIPLGLTGVASATDAAIQKKIFGSGMTTLIILNEEIDNIMKRVKFLEESGLLIKAVSEIKNEIKEQEDGVFSMLLNSLGTRLLVNLLTLIYYSLN